MKVEIRGHNTEVQPRWKNHIITRLSKLDRFEDKIIKVDYVLTSSHHHLKGFELCQITAKVPKKTIAVKKNSETMIGAIDEASKILEQKIHALWKAVKDRNRRKPSIRKLKPEEI